MDIKGIIWITVSAITATAAALGMAVVDLPMLVPMMLSYIG